MISQSSSALTVIVSPLRSIVDAGEPSSISIKTRLSFEPMIDRSSWQLMVRCGVGEVSYWVVVMMLAPLLYWSFDHSTKAQNRNFLPYRLAAATQAFERFFGRELA